MFLFKLPDFPEAPLVGPQGTLGPMVEGVDDPNPFQLEEPSIPRVPEFSSHYRSDGA